MVPIARPMDLDNFKENIRLLRAVVRGFRKKVKKAARWG
jgi:hypothetical protein